MLKKKTQILALCLMITIGAVTEMTGCGRQTLSGKTDSSFHQKKKVKTEQEPREKTLVFRDVFGKKYTTSINPKVLANPYDPSAFVYENDRLTYTGEGYTSQLGIDVSYHQGTIDWEKVAADGYQFAILRIGYRGYGQSGSLNADKMFTSYYEGAKKAGLMVGVYFYAQAINEKEAAEEARFVLKLLGKRKLDLPIVYDPENVLDDTARTDDVTPEQFTANAKVFCERIQKAGFQPMLYANMLWEAFQLDLSSLPYPLWYADYEKIPQTPYMFQIWQYKNDGKVDGIHGNCDLNIRLIPKGDGV
jgi:GH25 family lysozyme M1 (1,4-beta-N-acetylmuramidase)